MADDQSLIVSETFYSIQGESETTGIPAVFLRLTSCNLTCSGWSAVGKDGKKVGCDSTEVWKTGTKYSFDELLELWSAKGFLKPLFEGAHLVITGGEPLLRQKAITAFLKHFSALYRTWPFIEIETNGTIPLDDELSEFVSRVNCSPKLSNNGDPDHKRYVPEALEKFARDFYRTIFKFVICNEEDLQEVYSKYIRPFSIPKENIVLMPEGATHEDLKERSKWLIEVCKREVIRYSPRLHVHIYDQVTGV